MDGSQGFWLIHSLPKVPPYNLDLLLLLSSFDVDPPLSLLQLQFPDLTKPISSDWDTASTDYGQTFLCVTVDASTVNDIAGQVLFPLFHKTARESFYKWRATTENHTRPQFCTCIHGLTNRLHTASHCPSACIRLSARNCCSQLVLRLGEKAMVSCKL